MNALAPAGITRPKQRPMTRVIYLLLATVSALLLAVLWYQVGQWYHGQLLMREQVRVRSEMTIYAQMLEWTMDRQLGMVKVAAMEGRSPSAGHVTWTDAPMLSADGQHLMVALQVDGLVGGRYRLAKHLPIRPLMQAAGLENLPDDLVLAVLDARGRRVYGPNLADEEPISAVVRLPGTFWLLEAVPAGGWERAIRADLWGLQSAIGLCFLAVLVAVCVALRRQRRLAEDVDLSALALEMSEASFRQLFNAMSDPLLVVTPTGDIVEVNSQTRLRFGRDGQLPSTLAQLLQEHGIADDAIPGLLLAQQDTADLLPLKMARADAPQSYFEATTTAFLDEQGQRRLLIVLHDVTTRTLGEQALIASEMRYRDLVENSPEGILLLRLDGQIAVANRQAAALAGYAGPESFLRAVHRYSDLVAPSDREHLGEVLLRAVAEGAVRGETLTLVQRDGRHLPVEANVARLTDDGGQGNGLIVAMQDVSLRWRVQARNRAYREKLSLLARALSSLIDLPDRQSSDEAIAQTFVALAGARAAYLSRYGSDSHTVIPTAFAGEPGVDKALRRHVGTTMLGTAFQAPDELHDLIRQRGLQKVPGLALVSLGMLGPGSEASVQREMGVASVWVVALARLDATLGASLLLLAEDAPPEFPEVVEAYAHAVTSWMFRHRAARTLLESEERNRSLITHLGDALIIVDQDLRIADFHDTATGLIGMQGTDLSGVSWAAPFAPLVEQGLTPDVLLETLRRQDHVERVSGLLWQRQDGTPGYLDAVLFAIRFHGAPHLALLLRDVTERHALMRQVRDHERLDDLGRFAAGAAHDLRHIVALIRHELPQLEQAIGPDNVEASTMLRMLDRAVLLGDHFTTTLVDYNQDRKPVLGPLHINVMLRIERPLMQQILGDEITLHFDLASELIFCLADERLFERAWLNLLINARDAMPHGGRLTISTRLQQVSEDDAASAGLAPGAYGVLSVSDTGHGLTQEQIERVFDPFFSTKQTSLAAGLGLAVVKRVMRQHHGIVSVSSRLGVGSTFELYFPALPEKEIASSMAEMLGE